ncbi:MAG TPA: 50S ribosomal protein L10 [Alphaproteobacteria bacterium]|nr:50S ribosomal protein L10 [Alphaproteobacteria bacterium]
MNRAQKAEAVAELQKTLSGVEAIVVTQNAGLTAAQSTELRVQMRNAGVSYKVSKNRLVLRALEGTRFEGIGSMLKGPVALATSSDPVAAAKVAATFAKTNDKLIIIGGALGDKTLDFAGVDALSKLPSLDEMRASLLALFQTPATRLAVLAQAPASQLARVTKAYADKG